MAYEIKQVQYFHTEVSDKPGEGARILQLLKDEGVYLSVLLGFPKGRRAQIDFVPANPAILKAAAKKAKLELVGPKAAFVIQGDDTAGALVEVAGKLAEAEINITALHAVAGGGGQYGAVLWVKPGDVKKAAKILLEARAGEGEAGGL